MNLSKIICKTLSIAHKTIELIAWSSAKLFCYFKLDSWSNAKYFGKPENAITTISEQLEDAGNSIDATKALQAINENVIAIIPQLLVLKNAQKVALTEITELHPIDQVTLSIGIKIDTNKLLGPIKIDGIGLKIQATKIANE